MIDVVSFELLMTDLFVNCMMIAVQASDVVPFTDGTEDPQSHTQDSKVGNAIKCLYACFFHEILDSWPNL